MLKMPQDHLGVTNIEGPRVGSRLEWLMVGRRGWAAELLAVVGYRRGRIHADQPNRTRYPRISKD